MGRWAPFRIVFRVVPEGAVELCKVSERGGGKEDKWGVNYLALGKVKLVS